MNASRFGKIARACQLMACSNPQCSIHIVLFDEADKPFAQAALSDDQARSIANELHAALYRKSAFEGKDPGLK